MCYTCPMTNKLTRTQYDRLAESLRYDTDPDSRHLPEVYFQPDVSDYVAETWVLPVTGVQLTHVKDGRARLTVYFEPSKFAVVCPGRPLLGKMTVTFAHAGRLVESAGAPRPGGTTAFVFDIEVTD